MKPPYKQGEGAGNEDDYSGDEERPTEKTKLIVERGSVSDTSFSFCSEGYGLSRRRKVGELRRRQLTAKTLRQEPCDGLLRRGDIDAGRARAGVAVVAEA